MRAIDADALIADLEYDVELDARSLDSIDSVGRDWETIWFDKNCKQNAIDLLQRTPTIEPEPHWIPCSERLPEEYKDVLVTVYFMELKQTQSNGWNDHIKSSYYVDIASHIDGEWISVSDEYKVARSRHKVIAWMPLPEPYQEGEQKDCNYG